MIEQATGREFQNIRDIVSSLDYRQLAEINEKQISELDESDLIQMGLIKMRGIEGELYCCKDIFGCNRYYEKTHNGFVIRSHESEFSGLLKTTGELIFDALLTWKLKWLGLQLDLKKAG